MKYSVRPQTSPHKIPKEAEELHLVRPISFKKIQGLCNSRPIQKISCSESCYRRLKPKTKQWLAEKGIELKIQKKSGRPLKIPLKKMMHIIELVKDHRTYREIEKTTEIPKSTAHYLVRYAHRDKVKQNGSTVFLE